LALLGDEIVAQPREHHEGRRVALDDLRGDGFVVAQHVQVRGRRDEIRVDADQGIGVRTDGGARHEGEKREGEGNERDLEGMHGEPPVRAVGRSRRCPTGPPRPANVTTSLQPPGCRVCTIYGTEPRAGAQCPRGRASRTTAMISRNRHAGARSAQAS
jgi:hypothetical protein